MITWHNMLLVSGTARNVGKTTFVCKIIEAISKNQPIIAIKITPHFHELCSSCKLLYKSEKLIIAEEKSTKTEKDSAKMLAAGAHRVFYVQGADDKLPEAIEYIKPIIAFDIAVICESAALRNYIKPGLFVLMLPNKDDIAQKNKDKMPLADRKIFTFNYQSNEFEFENGKWKNH